MFTISKTFDFDAAHFLPLVPDGHKCKRMHGHTYRVEIICDNRVSGGLSNGMVVDYAEIAKAWAPLHDMLDHRVLNEIPGLENPTTEVLAEWIWSEMPKGLDEVLRAIRVYESSTTWCEYRP